MRGGPPGVQLTGDGDADDHGQRHQPGPPAQRGQPGPGQYGHRGQAEQHVAQRVHGMDERQQDQDRGRHQQPRQAQRGQPRGPVRRGPAGRPAGGHAADDHQQQRTGQERRADQVGQFREHAQAGGLEPFLRALLLPGVDQHRAGHRDRGGDRGQPATPQPAPAGPGAGDAPGPGPRRPCPPAGQQDGQPVRRDDHQAEDVDHAERGYRRPVPDQPPPPLRRPPRPVRPARGRAFPGPGPGLVQYPDQQVAGHRGQRAHGRVRPGLLAVPADLGQRREHQPGEQPSPARDQPPPDPGHRDRGHRHGHRRRQPGDQFGRAEDPHDRPDHQVVHAVHGVRVAQHPEQVSGRAGHRGQRRALVPPVRRALDLPGHHGQREQRRQRKFPERPAAQPAPPARRGRPCSRRLPFGPGRRRGRGRHVRATGASSTGTSSAGPEGAGPAEPGWGGAAGRASQAGRAHPAPGRAIRSPGPAALAGRAGSPGQAGPSAHGVPASCARPPRWPAKAGPDARGPGRDPMPHCPACPDPPACPPSGGAAGTGGTAAAGGSAAPGPAVPGSGDPPAEAFPPGKVIPGILLARCCT